MPENRISPLTVANKETDERLLPEGAATPLPPAAGGWTPSFWQRVGLVVGASVLGSVGTALALPVLTPAAVIAAVMVGASTGLATLAGVNSAGPRKF